MARNEGSLKIAPKHKKKFFKNVKDFTADDIEAFASMMTFVNQIMEKKKEAREKSQERKPKPKNKDYLSKLKNKMLNSGVEEGGTYWNSVIGSYNVATDKVEFVKKWQKDDSAKEAKEQIQELRGIDNLETRVKTPEKSRTSQNQSKRMSLLTYAVRVVS